MSKIGTAYLSATSDDMNSIEAIVPELKLINDVLERGLDLPQVDMPEGFSGECND